MPERAKFIAVDKAAPEISKIAREVLAERVKHWRVDSVDIGIFPDLGRVGGYLRGGVLAEIDAGELLEVSGKIAEGIQGVLGPVKADIIFDGVGCTVGGKLDPDIGIGFDAFLP